MGTPGSNPTRESIDAFCQRGIQFLLLAILMWGPLAFGGMPEASFLVLQGMTILALALWAVRMWVQRPFRLFWAPACWAVFVFLLYALVRCQEVPVKYAARNELVQIIVYVTIFFLALHNLNRRESATIVTFCLTVLGLGLAFYAIYQFTTKHPTTWGFPRREQYLDRGTGTYLNPNHLAGYLEMVLPLALSYTLLSRLSATVKVFLAYCVLAMMAGVVVTMSRGGMVSVGVSIGVFCILLLFQRGYTIAGFIILIGLIGTGLGITMESEAFHKRMQTATISGHFDDLRSSYWSAAWQVFRHQPVFGAGPAHFDWAYLPYRSPQIEARPLYAHNDYLNTLADWGVVGLVIIAGFCALLFWGVRKTWPALRAGENDNGGLPKGDKSAFLIGAMLGLLALLVHSLFDFNMHVPANAILATVLMALICAQARFATENHWKNPRRFGKFCLSAVAIGTIGWLAWQGTAMARETYWQHQSVKEDSGWGDRAAALERAYEAEPGDYENSYNLGEMNRLASQEGNPDYRVFAAKALGWYARSMAANPLDSYVPMRYGMTLDLLGRTNEATTYFARAVQMDPGNYLPAFFMGRHWMECYNYPKAKEWFARSLGVRWNNLAMYGLSNLNDRLSQAPGLYKK